MATVVKILKKQPESDWIYHVTLSRRILFLQKLNFHMYMLLLMNDLKMFPMTFNQRLWSPFYKYKKKKTKLYMLFLQHLGPIISEL